MSRDRPRLSWQPIPAASVTPFTVEVPAISLCSHNLSSAVSIGIGGLPVGLFGYWPAAYLVRSHPPVPPSSVDRLGCKHHALPDSRRGCRSWSCSEPRAPEVPGRSGFVAVFEEMGRKGVPRSCSRRKGATMGEVPRRDQEEAARCRGISRGGRGGRSGTSRAQLPRPGAPEGPPRRQPPAVYRRPRRRGMREARG